ncbi:lysophospholipase L1-like esterase [Luteibacter rhizovicinus]|uniref:Lysophospholipase L1-like esterase n=1 Tax=Luteibacter rhizovicinus TaxID=242606 RepID=A0A4R3YMF6_9GAMM|nr:SGNH/GDSL hydrolase family protein [Luteibacter rhizovicinus]TCV93392.1 lysophospholipase L1-like esterase [Luteibacter rhizovicinus]
MTIKKIGLMALMLLTATCGTSGALAEKQYRHIQRIAVWAPSMTIGGPAFDNQTIRMVVHASVGGSSLVLHLSNLRGTTPLVVGKVSIAAQAHGAETAAGSLRPVTVSLARNFTIPAGAEVVSDPIPMTVDAGQNLLVSMYLPQATRSATWHSDAFDTTYLSESGSGDRSDDADGGSYIKSTTSWYYLSGMDIVSRADGTVVAFGDSITDGYNTPVGAYARWPDYLARRLADDRHPMGVVDAGIGGNRVLTDVPNIWQGISAIKRFGHDALEQPGVRTVILMEGINDIGNDAGPDGGPLTAQDLIDGYRKLIRQAHDAGVRIVGGTMLPNKGAGYYTEAHEAIRQACNQWIRSSGAFDGVIDFDRAMQDPSDPLAMRASYDSGDHLHPNAAGMQAMANAVDLRLLTK